MPTMYRLSRRPAKSGDLKCELCAEGLNFNCHATYLALAELSKLNPHRDGFSCEEIADYVNEHFVGYTIEMCHMRMLTSDTESVN